VMVADNPGVWFMHCHTETHAAEGMALVLNEARPNQNLTPPNMRIILVETLNPPSKSFITG